VNTVSDKVVRHSLAYLSVQKWLAGMSPLRANMAGTDHPRSKMPTDNQYLLVAHQP